MLVLVAFLQRGHFRIGVAAFLKDQFLEGIARAGRAGRAIDGDRNIRQRGIDIGPGLGRLFHAIGLGRQRLIDLRFGERELRSLDGLGHGDAIDTDGNLGHIGHAVLLAGFQLAHFHAARGIGHIGRARADAGAELLDTAAGAGRFQHRCGAACCARGITLGHGLGEGEDGRRANDGNMIARATTRGAGLILTACQKRDSRGQGRNLLEHRKPLEK